MFVNFLFVNFLFVNAFVIDGHLMAELFKHNKPINRTNEILEIGLSRDQTIDKINNDFYLTNKNKYDDTIIGDNLNIESKIGDLQANTRQINDISTIQKKVLPNKFTKKYSIAHQRNINVFHDPSEEKSYHNIKNQRNFNYINFQKKNLIYKKNKLKFSSQQYNSQSRLNVRNRFLLKVKIRQYRRNLLRLKNSVPSIDFIPNVHNIKKRDTPKNPLPSTKLNSSKHKLKKQYCHSRDPETLTYFSPIAIEVTITSISSQNHQRSGANKEDIETTDLGVQQPTFHPIYRTTDHHDRQSNNIYSAVFRINKVLKDIYNKLEPSRYIKLHFFKKANNKKKINCGYIFNQDFQMLENYENNKKIKTKAEFDESAETIIRSKRQFARADEFRERINYTDSGSRTIHMQRERILSNDHRHAFDRAFKITKLSKNRRQEGQNQRMNLKSTSESQEFTQSETLPVPKSDVKMYSIINQPNTNNQRFYTNERSFHMKQDFSEPYHERSSINRRIYSNETTIHRSNINSNRYSIKLNKNKPDIYSSITEHNINLSSYIDKDMNSELKSGSEVPTKSFPMKEKIYLMEADLKLSKTYVLFMNHEVSSRVYNVLSEPLLVTPKTVRSVQRALKTHYGKNPSINSSTSSHDVTGSVGERRQLVCRTTGEPPPRVTWFKKGTAGRLRNVPRKRQTERSRFVGTNGKRTKVESGYRIIHHRYRSTLEFQNLTQSDDGEYQCKIKNGKNIVVQNIKLTVKSKEIIHSQIEPTYSECPHQQFCLNGGTCMFFVRLAEPACKCQDGFTGQRCESKDVSLQRATSECGFGTHFYC